MAILDRELARWTETVERFTRYATTGHLTRDVLERARFALDVLSTVTSNARIGVCCELVAVDPDDHALGAMTYFVLPPDKGSIGLLAIEPRNVPGSPTVVQYRGVGTAMLATAIQQMLKAGVKEVALHPLDADAERFWIGRGFLPCGGSHLLCVRGVEAMKKLVDVCNLVPEDSSSGQIVLCGLPARVRERLKARVR